MKIFTRPIALRPDVFRFHSPFLLRLKNILQFVNLRTLVPRPIDWLLCAIVSPATLLFSFWLLQAFAPLIPWLAVGWSSICLFFCLRNLWFDSLYGFKRSQR